MMRNVDARTGVVRRQCVDGGRFSSAHWRQILSSRCSDPTNLRNALTSKQLRFFSANPIPFGACRSVGTVQLPWPGPPPSLLASRKQLSGSILQLLPPLTHLNRVDSVIGVDLLDRHAATDPLQNESGRWVRHMLMTGSHNCRGCARLKD